MDNTSARQNDQDERMRRQEEELRRQRRELEELRRQRGSDSSYNGSYKDDSWNKDQRY